MESGTVPVTYGAIALRFHCWAALSLVQNGSIFSDFYKSRLFYKAVAPIKVKYEAPQYFTSSQKLDLKKRAYTHSVLKCVLELMTTNYIWKPFLNLYSIFFCGNFISCTTDNP